MMGLMEWLCNRIIRPRPDPPAANLDELEAHVDALVHQTERLSPRVAARLQALRLEWESIERERI